MKSIPMHARLSEEALAGVRALAAKSRWSIALTIGILVEEALQQRSGDDRPAPPVDDVAGQVVADKRSVAVGNG